LAILLSGACNEKGPVFSSLLCLGLLESNNWPVCLLPLIGVTMSGWWNLPLAPEGTDSWLQHPWQEALTAHRGMWLNWRTQLLPWGMVLPLALVGLTRAPLLPLVSCLSSLAVAYLMVLRSQDWQRLIQWAAVPWILMAASVVPEWAVPVVAVLHLLNNWRGV
jgi:hypothetical protein